MEVNLDILVKEYQNERRIVNNVTQKDFKSVKFVNVADNPKKFTTTC